VSTARVLGVSINYELIREAGGPPPNSPHESARRQRCSHRLSTLRSRPELDKGRAGTGRALVEWRLPEGLPRAGRADLAGAAVSTMSAARDPAAVAAWLGGRRLA
jgi:hypothetical protein